MTEYFLVALPYVDNVDQNPTAQFSHLQAQMGPVGPALRHFIVPPLKVGTLDSLMEASDELTKLDPQCEGLTNKLAGLLEEATGRPRKDITVHVTHQQEVGCETYLKQFAWNAAHYNVKEPIKALLERLAKESADAEERVRLKVAEYNETRQKLTGASRRGQGNLSVKPIGDAVTQYCQHNNMPGPIDTEFLSMIYVAVPAQQEKDFMDEYWTMHQFVCPKSATVLGRDKEFVLFGIVVFKKAVDDFKIACRKRKYIVREMDSSEDLSGDELRKLQLKAEEEKTLLTKLLVQQFSTCFTVWIHVKAIRLFVESLLKYGLPPRFIPVFLAVDQKKETEIRNRFTQLYSDLGNPYGDEHGIELGALQYEFPYVSIKVTNVLKPH